MQREVDKMISDCKDSLKQLEQYRRLIPQGAAAGAAGGGPVDGEGLPGPAAVDGAPEAAGAVAEDVAGAEAERSVSVQLRIHHGVQGGRVPALGCS